LLGRPKDFRQQASARRWSPQRSLMINHLDGLVAGPPRQTASRCQQMSPLPDSPSVQTILLVVTVAHREDTNQRSAKHQLRVAVLRFLRRNPLEHRKRHGLGNGRGHRRQAKGIDGQPVAIFLYGTPVSTIPPIAAVLHLWVGVKLTVRRGTYLRDFS